MAVHKQCFHNIDVYEYWYISAMNNNIVVILTALDCKVGMYHCYNVTMNFKLHHTVRVCTYTYTYTYGTL